VVHIVATRLASATAPALPRMARDFC
jgi:hypothetical protein